MSSLIRLFEKKKELLSNLQKNSRTQSKEFTKILKDFPIIEGSKLKSLQTTLTKQPTLPLYAPLKDSGFNLVFNEQIIKTNTTISCRPYGVRSRPAQFDAKLRKYSPLCCLTAKQCWRL